MIDDPPAVKTPQDDLGKLVFIIEGDPAGMSDMCAMLAHEPYRLETAGSAQAAIAKLSACVPDLILLNADTGAEDGTRLARRLLADRALVSVPAIELIEAGATSSPPASGRFDGRIQKPIDASSLRGQVHAFLEAAWRLAPVRSPDQALSAAAQDLEPRAASLLDEIEAGLPDSQHAQETRTGLHWLADVVAGLQRDELANYVQQAEQLSNIGTARAGSRFRSAIRLCQEHIAREPDVAPGLAELRARYRTRRSTQLSALEQTLKDGDFDALAVDAHKLCGTGAAFGFSELTNLGMAIEAAAHERNAAAIEVLFDQFESYVSLIRPPAEPDGDRVPRSRCFSGEVRDSAVSVRTL